MNAFASRYVWTARMRIACLRTVMLAVGLGSALAGPVAAEGFQSPDTIRQTAMAAVPGAGTAGVEVDAVVDPALRMPLCVETLRAQPATAGTMEVVCPGGAGWRLYVPVRVRRLQDVLVLQRNLSAGEAISGAVVALENRDVAKFTGALVDPQAIQGYSLRRPLAAGTVLTAADVLSPRLIRRGDSVTLVARAGGIEVRAMGRALGDAGQGERIGVENLSSRRMLQGVVGSSGEVEVGR